MDDELADLGRKISSTDQLLGWICKQTLESYGHGNFFTSFLGLSVLVEQAVREKADSVDGDYLGAVKVLLDGNAINESEARAIATLKEMQYSVSNSYMHAPGASANFAPDGEGVVYTYNEESMWEEFMKTYLVILLRITANLVHQQ